MANGGTFSTDSSCCKSKLPVGFKFSFGLLFCRFDIKIEKHVSDFCHFQRIITHSTASQNYGEDCQTVATVANNTYSPGYDNKMAASSNSSHGGHYFVISRKAAHVGDVASEQFNQGENKTLAVQHDGNNGSLSYGSSLHVDSELAFETPKTPVQLVVVQVHKLLIDLNCFFG